MVDTKICREFKSVDGPERNWRVARTMALFEAVRATFLNIQTVFDRVEFPTEALNYQVDGIFDVDVRRARPHGVGG